MQHADHYTHLVHQDPLIRTIDPAAVRSQLARRSASRVAAHPLWQAAQDRLADRLSYIRAEQSHVLRYGLREYGQPVQAAPGSLDMVWSVGLMPYLADIRATLGFWAGLLKPGGLLMFATLGPDSFRPLALALDDPSHTAHVAGYPDMHDLGDALVGLRMANPVMDAERLTLSYSSAESALQDLRALGGNPLLGRPRGLRTRAWRGRILGALESMRQGTKIEVPIELVFGHAWASPPRAPEPDVKPIAWASPPYQKSG